MPLNNDLFYVPDGILLGVPYTLHYWAAATDGCGIGILLGVRQCVAATTDGGRAVAFVKWSFLKPVVRSPPKISRCGRRCPRARP